MGSPSYPTDSAGTIWVLDTHPKPWTLHWGFGSRALAVQASSILVASGRL